MSITTQDLFKESLSALERGTFKDAERLVAELQHNKAVEALLPIVASVCSNYRGVAAVYAIQNEDILAIGNMALTEAVYTWHEHGLSLVNWSYQKVKREVTRFVQREVNYQEHTEVELDDEDDGQPLDPSLSAEEEVSEGQIRKWIKKTLTRREAEIVNLVYFSHITIRSIARREKVSAQAISKVHRRALMKLRTGVDNF